ncbi:MAG: UDP-N-acetylglucosamine 2-epimerase (hydrolyzing) [Lachnospiraceae bacterium]|nr:UDP-N-acetylglucosamine 2-epimerase (hydrolyzing) [Lachnospiraceae bacterium]
MRKIMFITGTRADYGKIKSLIREVENSDLFEAYVYVSGMHLVEVFGDTYKEVLKDNYKNVYVAYGLANTKMTSYDLGDLICNLTGYVNKIHPDMIVVHGDRIDALAGATVGALNNIRVAHIEGGELSGTIDESIRHAISKFAHVHFVSNEAAKKRLIQLGESRNSIHIIGSPDIDIMISEHLPSKRVVFDYYDITFDNYAVVMYHPVTTEYKDIGRHIEEVVNALLESGKKYIIIYPNNDLGHEVILNEYLMRLTDKDRFRLYPSLRFEYFLTILKNCEFLLGNSSAGIREASVYGIPVIDIGSRQSGRYDVAESKNIQHVDEEKEMILNAIEKTDNHRIRSMMFGDGNSTQKFIQVLKDESLWDMSLQKIFQEI